MFESIDTTTHRYASLRELILNEEYVQHDIRYIPVYRKMMSDRELPDPKLAIPPTR